MGNFEWTATARNTAHRHLTAVQPTRWKKRKTGHPTEHSRTWLGAPGSPFRWMSSRRGELTSADGAWIATHGFGLRFNRAAGLERGDRPENHASGRRRQQHGYFTRREMARHYQPRWRGSRLGIDPRDDDPPVVRTADARSFAATNGAATGAKILSPVCPGLPPR